MCLDKEENFWYEKNNAEKSEIFTQNHSLDCERDHFDSNN